MRSRALPAWRLLAAVSAVWLAAALSRGWVAWTPAFAWAACAWAALWVRDAGRPWRESPTAFVFLTCLAFYFATFRWHGGDDVTNSLIPLAVLRHRTLALTPVIDPFLTGKFEGFTVPAGKELLSLHPIATGILAIPFYVLPVIFHAPITEQFLHNLSKVSASFITAASAAAFYRAAAARASRPWALAVAFSYGLGSFAFSVSSQALWQHGTAQLGMALALWGAADDDARASLLTGFGLALAIAAREDSVFLAAAIGLWILVDRPRRVPAVVAGAAPVLALLLAYWFHYTGRFLPPATLKQGELFGALSPTAMSGLLLSPTRGLLPFCPAVAFAAVAPFSGDLRRRRLAAALVVGAAATWLFFSCYVDWNGGESFGPRYLSTVSLVLLYLSAHLEERIRGRAGVLLAWTGAAALGVWIHALGGFLTWPGIFDVLTANGQIWRWDLHPIANLVAADGPLGQLPGLVRVAIAAGCGCAFAAAARAAARALSLERGQAPVAEPAPAIW